MDERDAVIALRQLVAAVLTDTTIREAERISKLGYEYANSLEQARDQVAQEMQRWFGAVSDTEVFERIGSRTGRGGSKRNDDDW